MSLATFHAVCRVPHFSVPLVWDGDTQSSLFGDYAHHFRTQHQRKPVTRDSLAVAVDRGWRTPSHKAFDPGPFDVGAWVTWHDKIGTHTGQVWAVAGPHHRWVADGVTFHDVYDGQLVAESSAA